MNIEMDGDRIEIGKIVRHRHILRGRDLYVLKIEDEWLQVRYESQGQFSTTDLYLHEVELFIPDEVELE